jgi:hypothetical protein
MRRCTDRRVGKVPEARDQASSRGPFMNRAKRNAPSLLPDRRDTAQPTTKAMVCRCPLTRGISRVTNGTSG